MTRISKGGSLAAALNPKSSLGVHEVIPYIDKFMVVHPYAGVYEVDDSEYVSKSVDRAHAHFHPSGDCLKCERLLYFERDESCGDISDVPDSKLQRIFKTGSALHAMVQSWFRAWGDIDGFPTFVGNEVRIDDKTLNIGGYIDSVIRFPDSDHDTIIEIKTINTVAFQRLREPLVAHKMQVGCYMASTGIPEAIVLYIDKNSSDMVEFRVEPFDLSGVFVRWGRVMAAVDAGTPDGLQFACKPGSKEWERCPARFVCHRGDA